ncbi:N-acetylglucosamine kinase [Streptomyces zhihengii]|uniref:ATPase n=1 Tax=Streptomyces zhihengii TaxID=1818004 RepID=A0ABS2UZK4_9ACTN|nr:BadF/BadG/BcrA/BcrD ATPase family protein [Streptomyces zhihengii]MBM9623011.1 ATPase [Streptomyces zhihengii]
MPVVTGPLVLGVDSGGSGLRVALADAAVPGRTETLTARVPVRTGPDGIDAGHMRELLLPMARSLLERSGHDGRDTVSAVVIGAAGMATLGDGLRAELPRALGDALGARTIGLAADAVTAYAGALGQAPGAVVAAGTGMIALGTDLTAWRRADGWGHLLGDCGSGAWIGRAGLEAALRAHDGRRGGSQPLLERMTAVLGPAQEVPALLYPRTDRPAVLAAFAPEVAACAGADPVAAGILARAAEGIAESAAAVCPPAGAAPEGCRVSLTGGLLKMGDPLLVPLRAELTRLVPHAVEAPAGGDPLAGSLLLAGALATDTLRLPTHPTMLHVCDASGRNIRTVHDG